ncbi:MULTISPECIES: peptidoglycan DD-metalloendopeptidase family protein [unclassified Modicisalibacter]|uniref:peptidoglycan DD-metalloendopeptidase family protein n=1 Tax=unclassified Modicisalibacter TaxID=2679913 RepID=UPI001CCDE424|nr:MULTISPECIES: peptidoglycan DD-metalloendopeptidase family protein [unclassified Modicisalibacter]MBZ9557655.1 peptidoglycan DD-metalloendopeptidase family protein [Modicisalibacter sp. R2A 31.J]MBZ9573681.1 peptidoglycan DD-metalloendopeptidase family protein [Modicisalibacter sp. MOD 31.J]
MRKVFLISALSLAVAGCASSGGAPQVNDLSISRNQNPPQTVTVEKGDTLYGIAWRNNMDFRELARLNGITPPYRIQPGETLRLDPDADVRQAAGTKASAMGNQAAVATTEDGAATAGTQNPDWLVPDNQTIQRNQRLTGDQPGDAGTPSGQSLAAAATAGGSEGPGPIYNYGSPGADGSLSAHDRAESKALAEQRAKTQAGQEAGAAEEPRGQSSAAQPAQETAPTDTVSSSTPSDNAPQAGDADKTGSNTRSTDAGTAVAGGASAPTQSQRTYKPVSDIPWQWPVDGKVVGRFSDESNLTAGIDIAGQKGQPVRAAGPGIVVYAGDGVRGYGNLILLKHNDHFLSAYAHNDSLRVKENDVVKAGEVIATMGNSDADSVKLHFEVRKDGQPQDPLDYLPSR